MGCNRFSRWSGCARAIGIVLAILVVGRTGEAPSARAEETLRDRSVLILHSYHEGYAWTDSIDQGIRHILEANPGIELYVEYMDGKRHPESDYFEVLKALYQYKYKEFDIVFDAIVCSDDLALDFLLAQGDFLFPGIPIVFCGINDFQPRRIAGRANFTGINEEISIRETLDLALRLHPEARLVAIVSDSTETGRRNRQTWSRIAPDYASRVNFLDLAELERSELREGLAPLTPRDIVLYLSYLATPSGQMSGVEESVYYVSHSSAAPVYSCWDFLLPHGIVGGKVVNGQAQGEEAARMALRLIQGTALSALPVLMESPNRWMFDFNQLERFGIRESDLPRGSVILNQPVSFWKSYWKWLALAILFSLFQSYLIVRLGMSQIYRRRAQRDLQRNLTFLETLLETSAAPIFFKDMEGRYQLCNTRFCQDILGLPRESVIGRRIEDIPNTIPPELGTIYRQKDEVLKGSSQRRQQFEAPVACSDGQRRQYLFQKSLVSDSEGRFVGIVGVMTDISDQRQKEADLRLMSLALDQIQDRVTITDLSGRITYVNWAQVQSLGCSREELIGKSPEVFGENPDKGATQREILEATLRHGHWRGEVVNYAAGGNEIVLDCRTQMVRDEQGKPVALCGFATDITQRKRMEKALRDSEERYRILVNQNPLSILVARNGQYLFANPAAARSMGYLSPEEMIGLPVTQNIDPADMERMREQIRQSSQGQPSRPMEIVVNRVDGLRRIAEIIFVPIQLEDGPAVLGMGMDISELRQAEARYRNLVQTMTDGYWLTDRHGKILEVNDSYCRLMGYTREELLSMSISELEYNEDTEEVLRHAAQVVESGNDRFETRHVTKGGLPIDLEVTATYIDLEGGRLFCFLRDISKRKQMESALIESENRFRQLAESIDEVFWLRASDRMLYISPAYERIWGRSCQSLYESPSSFMEAIYPGDIERISEAYTSDSHLVHGRFDEEYRIIRPDGSMRWIWARSFPIHDVQGGSDRRAGIAEDITLRKQAEEALRIGLARLVRAERVSSSGNWEFNMKTGQFYASEGACRIYGLKAGEGTIAEVQKVPLPEYRPMLDRALKTMVEEGKPYDLEFKIRRQDNGEIAVIHSVAEYDLERRIVYGVIQDITERDRYLSLVQARFRLGSLPLHFSVKDLLVEVLDEAERLTGSTIGFCHFVDPDQSHILLQVWSTNTRKHLCHAAPESRHYPIEEAGVWIDGLREKRPVIHNDYARLRHRKGLPEGHAEIQRELICPVIRNGKAVALIGVGNKATDYHQADVEVVSHLADQAWDIVLRKQAEEAVRENEARYRALFEATTDAIYAFYLDEQGMPGGLFETNEAACRMLGYTREDLLNMEVRDIDAPDSGADVPAMMKELKAGRDILFRQTHRSKDGQGIPVEVHARQLEYKGRTAVFSTVRDLSERLRQEEQRLNLERRVQQTQRLESLGVLAGGIAHDFNNMLMAVMGHANLALLEKALPEPAEQSLHEIERASRRAADLCRQLLAYSGQGHFTIETIDLNQLVNEMLHLLKTSISKKAALEVKFEPKTPLIRGDASQIRQIVMNLVINASEAIGEGGGSILVRTGSLACTAETWSENCLGGDIPEGLYVYLEVKDDGCGMDRETQARIFDPFFTTKIEGRGLGMSAVQGIVRSHRGALRLASQPGKGSVFQIFFPAVEAEASAFMGLDQHSDDSWRGQGIVLLADDDAAVRELTREMLQRLGFEIIIAEDGLQAFELFRKYRSEIRLVLLDLSMPRMDGMEAYREIRKMESRVPVVMCSGYAEKAAAEGFPATGLDGFVHKPYSFNELRQCLKGVLEKTPDRKESDAGRKPSERVPLSESQNGVPE